MAIKEAYFATALIGGTEGALDTVNGDLLDDQDAALVIVGSSTYLYQLDADSGVTESSPYVITPDTNPGTKRWVLVGLNGVIYTNSDGVGIGISNPTVKLHVYKDHESAFMIETGDDSTAQFYLKNTVGLGQVAYLSSGLLGFRNASSGDPQMVLDSSGNIGIGIISPSYKLHVSSGADYNSICLQRSCDSDGPPYLSFRKSRGTTTIPAVVQNGDALLALYAEPYTDTDTWGDGGVIYFKAAGTPSSSNVASNIEFRPNNGSGAVLRMLIQSDGKIGIGTSSPLVGLDVISTDGKILFQNTTTDNADKFQRLGVRHYDVDEEPFYFIYSAAENGANTLVLGGGTSHGNAATVIRLHTAANSTTTGGTERMRITSDGNIGVGINTPTYLFEVQGIVASKKSTGADILLDSAANYQRNVWFTTDDVGRWKIGVNNDDEGSGDIGANLRIERFDDNGDSLGNVMFFERSTGYIGIGTDSPTEQLHVESGQALFRYDRDAETHELSIENQNTGTSAAATLRIVGYGNNIHLMSYGDNHSTLANHNRIWTTAGSSTLGLGVISYPDAIYIKDNGYIGIGNNDPQTITHMSNSSGADILRIITGAGGWDNIQCQLSDSALSASNVRFSQSVRLGGTQYLIYGYDGSTYKNFVFYDYANAKTVFTSGSDPTATSTLTIDTANGNVAIGTPTTAGSFRIAKQEAITELDSFSTTSAHRSYVEFRKSHNATIGSLTATVTGENFGDINWIGVGSSNTYASGAKIFAFQSGNASTYVPTDISFQVYDQTTSRNHLLYLSHLGYVGISNSNPAYKLDVLHNLNTEPPSGSTNVAQIYATGGGGLFSDTITGLKVQTNPSGTGYTSIEEIGLHVIVRGEQASGNPIAAIFENGNVGIGTTDPGTNMLKITGSASSVIVNGAGDAIWSDRSTGFVLGATHASGPLILYAGNAEKMRIESGGNIGIGTTSPEASHKLQVNGNINLQGTNKLIFGSANGGYADIGISGANTGNILFRTWDGDSFEEAMRLTTTHEVLLGTTTVPSANGGAGILVFGDHGATDPTMGSNTAGLFAKDESGTVELFAIDEASNATKISPHNEEGEWEYYSRNIKTGKVVRINMEEVVKTVEELSGKKLLYNE